MEKIISETERLMAQQNEEFKITPKYMDDDLLLIDNVRLLGVPDAVYTNMNVIACCRKGKCRIMINGDDVEVNANQIFICPPEMSLDNILVSPDFEYQALCITNRMLQTALKAYIKVWNQLTYVEKIRVVDMDASSMAFYEQTYKALKICTETEAEDETDEAYKNEVFRGMISAALIGFCNVLRKHSEESVIAPKQNVSLFNRFLELLQTADAKHRTVEYYATRLNISSKYLTVICKKNSGKTANQWIQEYTLSAITHYLRTTEKSIKEISFLLGFPNTSFFGKYVKDHLGCSPLEYRRQTRG